MKFWKLICISVILGSFLTFPVFGERLRTQETSIIDGSERFYSEQEVTELVNELGLVAVEQIEAAAAEAARVAAVAAVKREAAAIAEGRQWREKYLLAREKNVKTAVWVGAIGIVLGAVVGGVTAVHLF